MTIKDPNYWKRIAKANATTINGILWFGLICSITIIGLSFTKDDSVTIAGVKIPLQYSWIPLTLFTIFHLIYTLAFEKATRNFWNLTEPKEYSELFKDITSEGGYFMREMQPRVVPEHGGPARMENDLSTWLTHITAILFFIALWRTINFDSELLEFYLLGKVIPFILTCANWIIGSRWAIVLSELAIKKEYSKILARKRRTRNGNKIPTIFEDEDTHSNEQSN